MDLSFIPDPFRIGRNLLDRVENDVNALATRHMDAPQFVQAMFTASKIALGARHLREKSLEALYRHAELPSRSEVQTLAAAIRRVEDKLDMLLPPSAKPLRPARPARTRLPQPGTAESPEQKPQAKATKRAAKPGTKVKPLPQPLPQAEPQPQKDSVNREEEGHGSTL